MRNLLLIILISLHHLFVFSQENETNKNNLHLKIFKSMDEVKENNASIEYETFEEMMKVIYIVPSNNSEGKFALFQSFKKDLEKAYQKETNTIFSNTEAKDARKIKSIVIESYTVFINEIIHKASDSKYFTSHKIPLKDIENEKFKKQFLAFSNSIAHDKLNAKINVSEGINIEIGQNIYNYINKTLKTELDKTLQNSLNLLVINW